MHILPEITNGVSVFHIRRNDSSQRTAAGDRKAAFLEKWCWAPPTQGGDICRHGHDGGTRRMSLVRSGLSPRYLLRIVTIHENAAVVQSLW